MKLAARTELGFTLRDKRKAITTLLPYAVRQERERQPEMLDVLLRVARASRMLGFIWRHDSQFINVRPSKATLRAVVLASPHIYWDSLPERGDLVQRWAQQFPQPHIPKKLLGV